MSLFNFLGRYFWALGLLVSAYRYVAGMRTLLSRDAGDPTVSWAAVVLRRWFAAIGAVPWIVMGWGIIVGGVPGVWSFLRPQDANPYVLAWFGSIFAITLGFAFWVFFFEGAQKVVVLKPVEIEWHRTGFRGTTRGTVELTVGRVRLFAAAGPIWIAFCTYLMYVIDAPLPK